MLDLWKPTGTREFQLLHCTLQGAPGWARGHQINQATTGKWFSGSAQVLQAQASSTGWVKKTLCVFIMVEHAAVLEAAPLSRMQSSTLQKTSEKIPYWSICHCCYEALKLCTSAFSLPEQKQRGLRRVYIILDHFACRCITWNFLPSLIHWHPLVWISLCKGLTH